LKLFIHIGAHKTGTTSIQMAMADSGPALAEAGFVYPRCCWYIRAQHRLAFALKGLGDPTAGDKPAFETELADLKRALGEAPAGAALISSEEFFSLKDEAVARLAAGLKDYAAEIIAFVRRPDEMFLSGYNQITRHPGNRIFKPLERHLENPAAVAADIEYLDHIGKWAAHFGKSNVHLAVYEGRDVVDTICQILRIDARRLDRPEAAANQSVSGKTLELMRHLKALRTDAVTQKVLYKLAVEAYPPATGAGKLSNRLRRDIIERYAEKNDALFRLLGAGENPYHPARIELPEEGPPENLSKRDLVKLIVKLMQQPQEPPQG